MGYERFLNEEHKTEYVESEVSDTDANPEEILEPDEIVEETNHSTSGGFNGIYTDLSEEPDFNEENNRYGEGFWEGVGLISGGVLGIQPEVREYVAEVADNIEPGVGSFVRSTPFLTFTGIVAGRYAGAKWKRGLDKTSGYLEGSDMKYSERLQDIVSGISNAK